MEGSTQLFVRFAGNRGSLLGRAIWRVRTQKLLGGTWITRKPECQMSNRAVFAVWRTLKFGHENRAEVARPGDNLCLSSARRTEATESGLHQRRRGIFDSTADSPYVQTGAWKDLHNYSFVLQATEEVYADCINELYRPRVLGQWFDGIRIYAAASSPTRSRRTWRGFDSGTSPTSTVRYTSA